MEDLKKEAEQSKQEDAVVNKDETEEKGSDCVPASEDYLLQPEVGEESVDLDLDNNSALNDDDTANEVELLRADVGVGERTNDLHISIQKYVGDLESLVEQGGSDKNVCPLCPKEKYRPCHVNKLLKHLQNLHWRVSVEFEGYRMCHCYLPCGQQNEVKTEDEAPSKIGAHYHCIMCSAMISRRTDMISHVKRHVNKGETDMRSGKSHEILKESNTNFQVLPNFKTPEKTDTFFNPKMKNNRQLIFCALAVLAEERKQVECLDAFGSTEHFPSLGIMGLQWAKHLGNSVKVTINDFNDSSVAMIRENCLLNKMKVLSKKEEEDEEETEEGEDHVGTIEVTQFDANVLMHLRPFDFIHLDPFGTSVNFLDAAFRNVRNMGIVSVTSTDTGSLYAKNLNVAKRHYGCSIVRTEYFRELAARIVLGSVARAAARCNKGIEVLLAVALEHFVLVVVRVLRGPTQADESAKKVNPLIHCTWCEERIFQKEGNMLDENPYKQLPCDCHQSMPGKSAIVLGPMWSGSLYNTGFIRRMMFEAVEHGIDDIQQLLKTLICEAECTTLKQFSIHSHHTNREESGVLIKIAGQPNSLADQAKRKRQDTHPEAKKRLKNETHIEHPPFYYSIHRHSIRGMNIPKLNKFLQYLSEAGFQVSRTHFDPTGVRTNATLATFKSILEKYSSPAYTSQASGLVQATETTGEYPSPLGEPNFAED
ncbi:TRMT1-like protein isoform 2-T2 [Discoglossus pictus]